MINDYCQDPRRIGCHYEILPVIALAASRNHLRFPSMCIFLEWQGGQKSVADQVPNTRVLGRKVSGSGQMDAGGGVNPVPHPTAFA